MPMCGVRAAAPSSCRAPRPPTSFGVRSRTIDLQTTSSADRALWLPQILTRSGWYDAMHARLPSPPRRLSELEREVLLNAAARDVAESTSSRRSACAPGLLVEMLGALRRSCGGATSSVDAFERLVARDLERDADVDRGAERLLKQTRFLAAAFRGYEARARRDRSGRRVRACGRRCSESEPARPLRQVVVTVGERSVDPAGLWPADLDSADAAAQPRADRYRRHARDDRRRACSIASRSSCRASKKASCRPIRDEPIDRLEPSRARRAVRRRSGLP